jgi:hypothetical protein
MTYLNNNPECPKRLDGRRFGAVGTRHRQTLFGHHPRDATHPTAADADEMDSAQFLRQFSGEVRGDHESTLIP